MQSQPQTAPRRGRSSRCSPASTRRRHGRGAPRRGASSHVVAVLDEARKQNRPTLAITNDPESPLALAADCVLQLHAGEERAVAATKTYLNSIAAVALLSTADDPKRLADLLAMPEKVGEQIEQSLAGAGALDR